MNSKLTPEKKLAFLAALSATCSVTRACEAVGISRQTAYEWRELDIQFSRQWEEAKLIGAEALEDEMVRRAKEGYDQPVYYKGQAVGTIRKYSDTLLIFALKGAMPYKYGNDKPDIQFISAINGKAKNEDEMNEKIAAIIEKATQRRQQRLGVGAEDLV